MIDWTKAAAELLGFPNPERDQEWLAHSVKGDDDSWIVQLTQQPLDFEREDHLAAVIRAYKRFRAIGQLLAQ